MKAIVTGARGTVGAALCARLRGGGDDAVAWDRAVQPPLDEPAARELLDRERPDVLFHLAIPSAPGPVDGDRVLRDWPAQLARLCGARGVVFVFTSTVMVFSDRATGPFETTATPDATEGYGAAKLAAERAVLDANPEARVARLGWQIDLMPGSNTMADALTRQAAERRGAIAASRRWLPACSFLADTAEALVAIAEGPPGSRHVDANRGWSFFEIATALSARLGAGWRVEADDAFAQDQRLLDPRLAVGSLADSLPTLRPLSE